MSGCESLKQPFFEVDIYVLCEALQVYRMHSVRVPFVQASVETVIKVSGKHKDEDDIEAELPLHANSTIDDSSHGQAEVKTDRAFDTGATPKKPSQPPSKPKEHKHHEASVEAEIDRIIDAQDNEYILSKPKYVSFCHGLARLASDTCHLQHQERRHCCLFRS